MTIVYTLAGNGIAELTKVAKLLGSRSKAERIYSRGINHIGNKGFTRVKRSLSKQVGLPQNQIVLRGALRKHKVYNGKLSFEISSRGGYLPLREFMARQFSYGVAASPWGRRQRIKSVFIVDSLGGNVFRRVGSSRFPIKMLWGPAIPNEMVRRETAEAFSSVATELPDRINHELRRATGGQLS